MKCPLRFSGQELDVLKPPGTRFICLKEECAWWDFERGCCCHKSIYLELDRLAAFAKHIKNGK